MERLIELDRGDVRERPGWIVSKRIWRVYACPMKMLRIGMNGDGESCGGNRLTRVYLENGQENGVYGGDKNLFLILCC